MATAKKTAEENRSDAQLREALRERQGATSLGFLDGEQMVLSGPHVKGLESIKLFIVDAHGAADYYDVAVNEQDDGSIRFAVPELFDSGPPQYLICGDAIPADSFVFDDYQLWKKYQQDNNLTEKQAKITSTLREVLKKLGQSDDQEDLQARLKNMGELKTELLLKEKHDFENWDDSDEEKLKRYNARIKNLKATLEALEQTPEELRDAAGAQDDELERLTHEQGKDYLMFVHKLAALHGYTKQTLEGWLKKATGLDFQKSRKLVNLGNAGWTAGREPQPLNRAQRREMQKSGSMKN